MDKQETTTRRGDERHDLGQPRGPHPAERHDRSREKEECPAGDAEDPLVPRLACGRLSRGQPVRQSHPFLRRRLRGQADAARCREHSLTPLNASNEQCDDRGPDHGDVEEHRRRNHKAGRLVVQDASVSSSLRPRYGPARGMAGPRPAADRSAAG